MIRELVTRPVSAAIALIELPGTVQRSLRQANELMESSQQQLEAMQRQTDEALRQAERMNDLLGRVVRLTEPLESVARGGEYVGGRLKRALLGDEGAAGPDGGRIERAVTDAEAAAIDAEAAAAEAEVAADQADEVSDEIEAGPEGSAEAGEGPGAPRAG